MNRRNMMVLTWYMQASPTSPRCWAEILKYPMKFCKNFSVAGANFFQPLLSSTAVPYNLERVYYIVLGGNSFIKCWCLYRLLTGSASTVPCCRLRTGERSRTWRTRRTGSCTTSSPDTSRPSWSRAPSTPRTTRRSESSSHLSSTLTSSTTSHTWGAKRWDYWWNKFLKCRRWDWDISWCSNVIGKIEFQINGEKQKKPVLKQISI